MTTQHLDDALILQSFERRAAGSRSAAELTADVLATVASVPQRRFIARPNLPTLGGRPMVLLAATLALTLAGLAAFSGRLPAEPSPPGGLIAFVQATYGWTDKLDAYGAPVLTVEGERILVMAAAGGLPAPVVEVPGNERRELVGQGIVGPVVRWSPDGSTLAFRLFTRAPGLYVVARDGSGFRRVVELPDQDGITWPPSDGGFSWSPDGRRIAYTVETIVGSAVMGFEIFDQLSVVDVADGRIVDLGVDEAIRASGTPSWSPDGSTIAFARPVAQSTTALVVIDVDDTNERELFRLDDHHVGTAAWSADSRTIAFITAGSPNAPRDGEQQLHLIDADGSGYRALGDPHAGPGPILGPLSTAPIWSPSANELAWLAPNTAAITILEVDGSGQRLLARGYVNEYLNLEWSPDGSHLAFVGQAGPVPGAPTMHDGRVPAIYLVNSDGTGLRWLADGEFPAWAPEAE